jgi:hypothetical protein
MGYIALCAVIGIAVGLVLERVIIGMFVGAGLLLLGLLILIARSGGTDIDETEEIFK